MPLPITFGAASARGFGLFSALTAGGTSWIGLFGGTGGDQGAAVALDSFDNVYFVGYTDDTNIQLNKYNNLGVIQWQKSIGGTTIDYGWSVVIDNVDNIYICGQTDSNSFQVIKLNSVGTIQWQRILLGASVNAAFSITLDSSNNLYVCGYSTISASSNMQIAKYNSSGTLQWQQRISGPLSSFAFGIAVDSSSNVYVTGTADNNILILKYNSSGSLQWQRSIASAGDSSGRGAVVDSSGNIYICGYVYISFNLYELVLLRYNSAGTFQWQKSLGSSANEYGLSIAIDSSDNIYISGYVETSPGSTVFNCLIAKYDTSPNLQWQRTLSSSGSDYGFAITVDNSNNIYVCGASNVSGTNDFLIAKLPDDGSLTGTYTVGGYSFTYAVSTLTDGTPSLTGSTTSYTSSTSSMTDQVSGLTATTSSYTSSVTNI
jgi:uncharacterized delta-60 repeat protein